MPVDAGGWHSANFSELSEAPGGVGVGVTKHLRRQEQSKAQKHKMSIHILSCDYDELFIDKECPVISKHLRHRETTVYF